MLPVYGRQILEALRECGLFVVRALMLLRRRAHGQDTRERSAKTGSGRPLNRSLMGLLVVSLLLALHAAPAGRGGGLLLSGFGACGEAMLAGFANCSRFDPPLSSDAWRATAAVDPAATVDESGGEAEEARANAAGSVVSPALLGAVTDGHGESVRVADVDDEAFARLSARSSEHGALARDRDLSAAAVARQPRAGVGLAGITPPPPPACDARGACGVVQVSLR